MTPHPDREASDEVLARAAQQGEVRALETLLDRHQGKVLRVLRFLGLPAQDREDVAQEVFIRVFRHLKGFRTGQSFGAWLYRVTVNAAHDYHGRRGRAARGEESGSEGLEAAADGRPDPAESMQQQELKRALDAALEHLSERERSVFVLREIEGLETAQVARALGITSITVRRHLARARARLRKVLGEEDENAPLGVEGVVPRRSGQG